MIEFQLDGSTVSVDEEVPSLLDVLRDTVGLRTPKDGCSPQGQCGCCTVLVDGQPRVACVTPVRRVAGRTVTTFDGLGEQAVNQWAEALCDSGGSQCGFCTPGIVVRLEALRRSGRPLDAHSVDRALQAHVCRCTGWQTIREAATEVAAGPVEPTALGRDTTRDLRAAERRALIEGGSPQIVGHEVVAGAAGFAADTAPGEALVAVLDADDNWVVAPTLGEARRLAGRAQARRSTAPVRPPLELPEGDWVRTLRTSWVEPAYLEPDSSWCEPGGEPAPAAANGGAFGAKADSPVRAAARALADEHGRTVRTVWSRQDVVRLGPKRPPIAAGLRADGSGVVRVVRTPGIAEAIASIAPDLEVVEVDVVGPPTSAAIRAAGWAEAAVLADSLLDGPSSTVETPWGSVATVSIDESGAVQARVRCGEVLDPIVLRSYCIGAAHMALGWVLGEGLAVGDDGTVLDATMRSFGILGSADTPRIEVEIEEAAGEAVNGSDAVFAAVAAAQWRRLGFCDSWPAHR